MKNPNKFKKDFLHIGERVGKFNKDHPDQKIQAAWYLWKQQFGPLDNWYEAFCNWKKGFLKGVKASERFPEYFLF